MTIDKLQAEIIRILFGISVPNFQYHWMAAYDGKYELTAVQRLHPQINDPFAKGMYPLAKNTLQVLKGLIEAFPIFGIPNEGLELYVEIERTDYNVLTQWNEMKAAVSAALTTTEFAITLRVPEAVFISRIAPYQPSPHKKRTQNPQKLSLEETLEQVAARLQKQAMPIQPATFTHVQCLHFGIKNLLLGEWKAIEATSSAERITHAMMDHSIKVVRKTYTIPLNENFQNIVVSINMLIKALDAFQLDEYFKKHGSFTLHNGRTVLNLFEVNLFSILEALQEASVSTPVTIMLSLPEHEYQELIAPMAEIVLPNEEEDTDYIEQLVACNQRLVAEPLRNVNGFMTLQAHWYDSDEEEDTQHAGAIMIDLREPENDLKRRASWFFDQDEHDRIIAERQAAEAAESARREAVREAAHKAIAAQQAERRALAPPKPTTNSANQKAVDGTVKAINALNKTAIMLIKTTLKNADKTALLQEAWNNGDITAEAKDWLKANSEECFEKLNTAQNVLN